MHISATTLDDILIKVYKKLLAPRMERGDNRVIATKGATVELRGVTLTLHNPRARLSRTESRGVFFSCLGELLWYLSGDNKLDFIEYYIPGYYKYSDDSKTIHGGYGPRLFRSFKNDPDSAGQVHRILSILKSKPSSRQAIIQLFDSSDLINSYKDIPCTCTMQFFIRGARLHMITHMRSNDAAKGLIHDIFAFTMLQEIIARSLGIEIGSS